MGVQAIAVALSPEQRQVLEIQSRSATVPHRVLLRSKIILLAAGGENNEAIARQVGATEKTVRQWRQTFAENGMAGLNDKPRPGARRFHNEETDRGHLNLQKDSLCGARR